VIGLKRTDIDLKKGRALIRETKNDEQRTLALAKGCAAPAHVESEKGNSLLFVGGV